MLQSQCSVESMLGVAVQTLSLVVSLSNEALWSHGSHPSLGPHTSLMFPHHSPDNYRGRECHLSRASSTEDDSTRSVVCQTCSERIPGSHAHTDTMSLSTHSQTYRFLPKVNHMCPLIILTTHGMLDFFWPCSSRLPDNFSSRTLRSIWVSKQKACKWGKTVF